eukprot:CAMPEP_0205924894 /NCGR_PEP_ID=MMETSP1325-20131115/17241_1 /ASSEMBLY_ACC=CAM_ASM_000708 /TAXON_ID=236786 /ORGANISM="Florenciella sp., Strain RCC1007" /LENGTH=53 /DNA_ID=CAMNT_0053293327 /DNA_START=8 /DNA_END=166 /DNA_ORIENTATION=+
MSAALSRPPSAPRTSNSRTRANKEARALSAGFDSGRSAFGRGGTVHVRNETKE